MKAAKLSDEVWVGERRSILEQEEILGGGVDERVACGGRVPHEHSKELT